MQVDLFDHLLLLAAVFCAVTLVRLLRRDEGMGRGYAILVGAQLIAAVLAMGTSRFFGVAALALVVLTVAVPWVLEHASRWAFGRGRLAWVGRFSTLRAILMPGSGLSRQLPILQGLALLERRGVDAALAHFRRLADEADDGTELAVIHEQIVSMLFYGQRWDEGIAHYERRFQPGYAALRPTLALGLLRAYGESGRLETAANLLRALEEGPVGADPNTAELLGQARLTFLAYAGVVEPVDELVRRRRFVDLGLSAATANLFKGIAQTRAGAPDEAVETLTKVERLAGPRDRRVREAAVAVLARARQMLQGVGPAEPVGEAQPVAETGRDDREAPELAPELRGYVELVADRLREFVVATPPVRRYERPLLTYALMLALATAYGIHLLRGGGGMGLLELGALSEDLLRAEARGAFGRVFTAVWLHVELPALLFDVYAIWLAGQVVERMLGPARMGLVTIGSAVAGLAASVLALPGLWSLGLDSIAVVAATGGNLMAVGAIVAALWLLLPRRTPNVAPRTRRNLVVTLSLLLLANLLTSWPNAGGLGLAPVGLLATALVSTVIALAVPVHLPRWLDHVFALPVLALVAATGVAVWGLFAVDPEAELVDHRAQRCELQGTVVHTPIAFVPVRLERDAGFELPIVDGLLDGLERRDGSLVQIAVHRGRVDGGNEALAGAGEGPSGGSDGPSATQAKTPAENPASTRVATPVATEAETPAEPQARVQPEAQPDALALFQLDETLAGQLAATAVGPLPEPLAEAVAAEPQRWRAADLWRAGERVARVVERELPVAAGEPPATVLVVATPPTALDHAPALYAAVLADARVDPEAGEQTRCRVE